MSRCFPFGRRWRPVILTVLLVLQVLGVAVAAPAQDLSGRIKAVRDTLAAAPVCQNLGDYYWEIGDANGALASGTHGSRVTVDKPVLIASASKLVFGAYVVERLNGVLTPEQVAALEMRSGYDQLRTFGCLEARTIKSCLNRWRNGTLNQEHVGKFSYNGGHDQKLAVDLGLGDMDLAALNAELRRVLGQDLGMEFASAQPAGGMKGSPAAYAAFLRRIMKGQLRMSAYLGYQPVCTLPGTCPDAVSSPTSHAWHYSLNHWVEDGPGDDGAFSSAGAFGFYPWISADRGLYGIFAREVLQRKAGVASALCGAAVRRAWVSGQAAE